MASRSDKQYVDATWSFKTAAMGDHEWHITKLGDATRKAGQAWRDIHETHGRSMGDVTRTEAGRLVKSAQFAKAVLASRREAYEEAKNEAENVLRITKAQLERSLLPPADPGEAALFADIRAHLRSLSMPQRIALVHGALEVGGDRRIAHAAVAGPAMLGMLPPELHANYTQQFLVYVAPNEWGKAYRYEEAIKEAERGQALLEQHAKALIDFPTAEAAERSAT